MYKKVMVIDDNEIDRYVANHTMKKNSFAEQIVVKESAKAALEYLRSLENTPAELPNIIFLDIRMPEMDGFGFLEEFDKLPAVIQDNCKIMMLSTSLDLGDHERAKKNPHVDRFLNKPIDKDKLHAIAV
jgi:CheY-like chemotaxis protein